MGYTQYWNRAEVIDPAVYQRIITDFRSLIKPLRRMGSSLAGSFGTGDLILEDQKVSFNGPRDCGHESTFTGFGWPADDARGITSGRKHVIVGSWGNGPLLSARTCNGSCANETFSFPRVLELKSWDEARDGLYFQCCKTNFKPYDLAVTVFLVIAKHHLGANFRASTDGMAQHFQDGMELCEKHLGYGKDFRLG